MIWYLGFAFIVAAIAFVHLVTDRCSDFRAFAWILGVIAAFVVFLNLPWVAKSREEAEQERAKQAAADRQPRVISEADGCKVYAFKVDQWHYFTRCPNSQVTTQTNTEVCHTAGKIRVCEIKASSIGTSKGSHDGN